MPGSSKVYRLKLSQSLLLTAVLVSAVLAMITPARLLAQLSPGELHKAHAFLEGMENCKQCHGADRSNVTDNCLKCHTLIMESRNENKGLHARPEYKNCEDCHVEHQGRQFDLIHWRGGVEKFDHSMTGYPLGGRHAALDCRDCHRQEFIVDKTELETGKANLKTTFHGLGTGCLNCHVDEHRKQLSDKCLSCHNYASWKPPVGFVHDKTDFPLTGKHVEVHCDKCHLLEVDHRSQKDPDFMHFTPLEHKNCLSCHKDAHQGRLGKLCENCHSTVGWRVVSNAGFDHNRTRFPLEGRHVRVECTLCHRSDERKENLRFAACRDCHKDFHNGVFALRKAGGACEECHTVSGFNPAKFTLAQHDSTSYPLIGSHRAIPCLSCHRSGSAGSTSDRYRFEFAKTDCFSCHKDPHKGEVNKYLNNSGCESCHNLDSWRLVRFAHEQTGYKLEGGHVEAACRGCHYRIEVSQDKSSLSFAKTSQICSDCHKDTHHGQFASSDQRTNCQRCHSFKNWKAEQFDHNRNTRYKLDGAHMKVPCQECHKTITSEQGTYVLYKPLDTACASCHGKDKYPLSEGKI